MSATYVVIVVVACVAIGLATGLWMIRRGHDPRWLFIAVALGPLFVPAALECVERRPRLAASGPDGDPVPRSEPLDGPRVLVGSDGSPESERALTTALGFVGSRCGMDLLLVGRRGRRLSARLLGSVSADPVQHSSVPVLVVEPARR